jgi:hypothetical protein
MYDREIGINVSELYRLSTNSYQEHQNCELHDERTTKTAGIFGRGKILLNRVKEIRIPIITRAYVQYTASVYRYCKLALTLVRLTLIGLAVNNDYTQLTFYPKIMVHCSTCTL